MFKGRATQLRQGWARKGQRDVHVRTGNGGKKEQGDQGEESKAHNELQIPTVCPALIGCKNSYKGATSKERVVSLERAW